MTALTDLYRWEGFRQAVRVALAMAIAYYISLSMGWDRPQWAGLAVALCSLATTGDSINKGLLRILGTFLAGAVAIMLAAMFPQDRWTYLTAGTIYIAFCAYMAASTSRWYFWFIGGYVMALLAMAGGAEGSALFEVIVLRLQQTTMGLVVYLIVSSLMWPTKAEPGLARAAAKALRGERRLVAGCRALLSGAAPDEEAGRHRVATAHAIAALPAIQNGAELDSFDVWDKRRQWRSVVADAAELDPLLDTLRHTIADIDRGGAAALASGLDPALAEIDARLAEIERMLNGSACQRDPREIREAVAPDALSELRHFDRAAVLIALDLIGKADRLTRRLFDTVLDIRGLATPAFRETPVATGGRVSALDPDRLSAALRAFIGLWLVLFGSIYIPGLPMPPGVVPMVAATVIQLSVFPSMSLGVVVLPGLGATALAWAFHVFVMPNLHSYLGLGGGIFVVIFLVMILMGKPEHAIGRPIVTSFFVMVAGVQNEQSYNALFPMNYAIAFSLALVTVWIAGLFPVSFRPQPALRQRLHRFFASCRRLTRSMKLLGENAEHTRGQEFDAAEARLLPGRIRPWLGRQPAVAEGRVARERLDMLTDGLDMLSLRLRYLVGLRAARQATDLRHELRGDVRSWRLAIEEVLDQLARSPQQVDPVALRERLDSKLMRLTEKLEKILDQLPENAVTVEELSNMFLVLGAYRGLSEAIVTVAECADDIDWSAVYEERF